MTEKKKLISGALIIFQSFASICLSELAFPVWKTQLVSLILSLSLFVLFCAGVSIAVWRMNKEAFPLTVLLALFGLTFFLPAAWLIFVVYLLYPLIPYFMITLLIPSIRPALGWIKLGKIDKISWILLAVTIVLSIGALVLWKEIVKPDISGFTASIPVGNIPAIIGIMFAFAFFNSVFEEAVFRGVIQDGLSKSVNSKIAVIIIQGVLFGVIHYVGFPSGIAGAALAGIWGIALGWLRERTGGMLAPLIAHFFADAVIFLIMVASMGVAY